MAYKLQRLLKYSAVLGLVPFAQHSPQLQQWQQIYTVLLIVAHILSTIAVIVCVHFDDIFLSYVSAVCLLIAQMMTAVVILWEALLTYKPHFHYLNRSKFIEEYFLKELGMRVCWRTLQTRQKRKFGLFGLFIYGSHLVSSVYIFCVPYNGYLFYTILANVILRTRCLQIMLFLDYLCFYMEMLNMKLKSVQHAGVLQKRVLLDIDYELLTSFPYLLKLKRLYMEIFHLAELFNEMCGWSVYSLMTEMFVDIIVTAYWALLIMAKIYERRYLTLSFFTVVPNTAILFMMCYVCECIKRQLHYITASVQRLLKTSRKDSNVNLYNDLLNEFSLQIMDHPIEICAKGCFKADMNLLMQMFASIASYLVILWQFRLADTMADTQAQAANQTLQNI